MWPIVVGMGAGLTFLCLGIYFLVWAAGEHHLANKYREVLDAYNKMDHSAQPQGVGWSVTYKDKKGKEAKVFVPGSMDESSMLKELVKLGVPFNRITSSNRIG